MRDRGGVLALLACLLVVGVVSAAVPEFDPETTDVRPAAVGDWVSGDAFMARVVSVGLAHQLSKGNERVPAEEGTLWVVVTWEVAAQERNVTFADIALRTRRGSFSARKANSTSGQMLIAPGFTNRCTDTFQVPAELVVGAQLRPRPSSLSLTVYRAQVSIDLGITADTEVAPMVGVEPCATEVTR